MSGSSSPAGVTQTVQNRDPWSGAQPALTQSLEMAQSNANTPREYFPNSTVVDFSPQTEAALQTSESRAAGGAPGIDAAEASNFATTTGQFLGAGNPFFSAMMDRVSNEVRPRIDSQFARAGRSGSAGHAEAMSRAMADAGASLAYQNYGDERSRMMQGAQLAPGLYQAGFAPMEQLRQIGQSREAQAGAHLQDQIARFNFAQEEPRERTRELAAIAGGGQFGGTSTASQPYFAQSPWATGLGVASALASIYGNLNR